ncbi:MAG: hypothetical protein CL933_05230 [Deltaproteobacteria bacterium]|nr:hypothetical protein [Deltaproteobacteria bacterium]
MFLAAQVSLWPISGNPMMLHLMNPKWLRVDPVFANFERRLIHNVRNFAGPVVLANGDSHCFRVDRPTVDESVESIQTFTRREGFGSPYGHWVRIRVDSDRAEFFQFQQEFVAENLHTPVSPEERDDGFEEDRFDGCKVIVRVIQAMAKLLMIVGGLTIVFFSVKGVRRIRCRVLRTSGRPLCLSRRAWGMDRRDQTRDHADPTSALARTMADSGQAARNGWRRSSICPKCVHP